MLVTVAPVFGQEPQQRIALKVENENFLHCQSLEYQILLPTVRELD
jgi:hypothetical protein